MRPADITFLGLTGGAVTAYSTKTLPLGMTAAQYSDFTTTLHAAIKRDGITTYIASLKGSSVEFFSGHHKKMPFEGVKVDRSAIRAEFRKGHNRSPTPLELETIVEKLVLQWPVDSQRPRRRPFDAFFKLGISTEPSDYDVSLSSDEVMSKVVNLLKAFRLRPTKALIETAPYGFINKKVFNQLFPEIEAWRRDQTTALGRPVTVAAFPACGPPNASKKIGPLSSHRRPTDWGV